MKSQQQIDILIEKIRLYMPSSGACPVTVIGLQRDELKGLSFEPCLLSSYQLLFLTRTDFDREDLLDYISHTKEFNSIPITERERYLTYILQKMEHHTDVVNWSEKIASLGIGIAIGLSEDLYLCIELIEADLTELNSYFNFSGRNLKAYQLFEIYDCTA